MDFPVFGRRKEGSFALLAPVRLFLPSLPQDGIPGVRLFVFADMGLPMKGVSWDLWWLIPICFHALSLLPPRSHMTAPKLLKAIMSAPPWPHETANAKDLLFDLLPLLVKEGKLLRSQVWAFSPLIDMWVLWFLPNFSTFQNCKLRRSFYHFAFKKSPYSLYKHVIIVLRYLQAVTLMNIQQLFWIELWPLIVMEKWWSLR